MYVCPIIMLVLEEKSHGGVCVHDRWVSFAFGGFTSRGICEWGTRWVELCWCLLGRGILISGRGKVRLR